MKTVILFLFICLGIAQLSAQNNEWFPLGSRLYYHVIRRDPVTWEKYEFPMSIYLSHDTIIAGGKYRVAKRCLGIVKDSVGNANYVCRNSVYLIQQDADSVYIDGYMRGYPEGLIAFYKKNANVGDEWIDDISKKFIRVTETYETSEKLSRGLDCRDLPGGTCKIKKIRPNGTGTAIIETIGFDYFFINETFFVPVPPTYEYRLKCYVAPGMAYDTTYCESSSWYEPIVLSRDAPAVSPFRLYPNPVQGVLHVAGLHSGSLQLSSLTGRVVFTSTIHAGENTIPLPELPHGVYIATLTADGRTHHLKLLKQ